MITFYTYEYYEYYNPHDMYNLDWTVVFLFLCPKFLFIVLSILPVHYRQLQITMIMEGWQSEQSDVGFLYLG